ncbi:elongator complex protein 2 [Nematocida homosporus]|uniref:elongator complex protein 2 n=1 Tax=Nematocida homosporus TaxID=1912981 RepID=UPI00221EDF2D|nr:elongator complex protein 2 [Nematocida homosporus]KAI5187815.1 elongator complex protein 2 [Nematocida homosporus]
MIFTPDNSSLCSFTSDYLCHSTVAMSCSSMRAGSVIIRDKTVYYIAGSDLVKIGLDGTSSTLILGAVGAGPISSFDIHSRKDGSLVVVAGTQLGCLLLLSASEGELQIWPDFNRLGTPITTTRSLDDLVVLFTKSHGYLVGPEGQVQWETPDPVVDARLFYQDNIPMCVFGTYGGYAGYLRLDKKEVVGDKAMVLLGSPPSPVTSLSLLSQANSIHHFCVSLLSGHIATGIFDGTQLVRTGLIRGHKTPCRSVSYYNEDPTRILTASDDGTCAIWSSANGPWTSTGIYGAYGGAPLSGAYGVVSSTGNTSDRIDRPLLLSAGALYFGDGEGFTTGHRLRVRSVDLDKGLLLTSSDDATVRVWALRDNRLVEIFRPLTTGHPLVFAGFLDTNRILVAADENLLRTYTSTQLYDTITNAAPNTASNSTKPFTAYAQELSLTPTEEKEVNPILQPTDLIGLEPSLTRHMFTETHRAYGYPFEIATAAIVRHKLIAAASKASQREFATLIISTLDSEIIQKIPVHDLGITFIIVSKCQSFLATAGRDRRVALFKIIQDPTLLTGTTNRFQPGHWGVQLIGTLAIHRREILAICFAEDSQKLFTTSKDGTLCEYSTTNSLTLLKQEPIPELTTALTHYQGQLIRGTHSGHLLTPHHQFRLFNSPTTQLTIGTLAHHPVLISTSLEGTIRIDPLTTLNPTTPTTIPPN